MEDEQIIAKGDLVIGDEVVITEKWRLGEIFKSGASGEYLVLLTRVGEPMSDPWMCVRFDEIKRAEQ